MDVVLIVLVTNMLAHALGAIARSPEDDLVGTIQIRADDLAGP